ncbi:MAG: hypothetical protein IPH78_02910 [Bacteroidetes bacterium]|nr:hypothetical protein [Bacteroidota bacterium]
MKIWDDIKLFFYKRALAEQLKNLKCSRKVTNLEDAKSIGVIYDSTNPDNDIIVTKFSEELRKQGKTVQLMGYVHDTKIDHKADITVFNKNNLSWYMVPKDARVDKFVSEPFDLLFAANTSKNLPLEFIARLSKAKWRVGPFDAQKTDCYDLMVNTSGKTEVNYFLQQATHFLKQIRYDSK